MEFLINFIVGLGALALLAGVIWLIRWLNQKSFFNKCFKFLRKAFLIMLTVVPIIGAIASVCCLVISVGAAIMGEGLDCLNFCVLGVFGFAMSALLTQSSDDFEYL